MKTYIKLNAAIAPYRSFEEELEIYSNDIDYVWKIKGELISKNCGEYDGVVVFNDQEYPAKALKNKNRLLVLFSNRGEVYSVAIDTTYNPRATNLILFEGNNSNLINDELGFGDCYILEKQASDQIVENTTNRLNKLLKKDDSIINLSNTFSFTLQNKNLLDVIKNQSDIIRKSSFNVYKREKNLKRVFMYPLVCTAANDMIDYIKNERLIEAGEKFTIDQEALDKVNECVNSSIIKNNIKLDPSEENFIKKLSYDFVNSIVFKGNSAGVILGIVSSGCHDIFDVCEESPAQFLLYDFINVNGDSNVEWLIDTVKNMYELKDPKARGDLLLNSLNTLNKDKSYINDYIQLFSSYDTIRQNLGITNSEMSDDMSVALKFYKKAEESHFGNEF